MQKGKYQFDRNDHGDLYIEKKIVDEYLSMHDANRVIVNAEDVVRFLADLLDFVVVSKLLIRK